MATVQIDAGRKQKIRPGDVLGALTGDAGLNADAIGKITIADNVSHVAVTRTALRQAMSYLSQGKVKGRAIRARHVGSTVPPTHPRQRDAKRRRS